MLCVITTLMETCIVHAGNITDTRPQPEPPRKLWAPGQKETWPPPPILQIMILKLSSPRYVIRK